MPTLNWIGKDKVVNHHLDVPFYTLEHKYGFRGEDERCQIGTLNKGWGQHYKYLPFAFTKIGVAMLSGVLNSQVAIQTNRKIMRALVPNWMPLAPH